MTYGNQIPKTTTTCPTKTCSRFSGISTVCIKS
jgi:hypothetical protein